MKFADDYHKHKEQLKKYVAESNLNGWGFFLIHNSFIGYSGDEWTSCIIFGDRLLWVDYNKKKIQLRLGNWQLPVREWWAQGTIQPDKSKEQGDLFNV
jgi:hypothetical protein